MATSGQTLNDRINAARYALAGQGLARCVCKATTEEVIGPKKKHLEYLIACTHEPNVSIPQLANLLIERTNHIQWVVVFKALVTVHQLMSFGNERFIQYLASSNYSFELSTFLDKTSGRDFSMSTFIRRYSRYINEKAISYRKSAFDFCKIKRGNEGVLRTMPIDRLLKTLLILQDQLDALLDFDCSAADLNNGVINACFMLLFRDLIGLYACHADGIINLLNRYFTLNKKMCREAFDLYKKFLVRMDKVSEFLRVAEVVGIDRSEIPDLRRAPSSLIDALEQHLQNLESNKKILKQSAAGNDKPLEQQQQQQLVGGLSLASSSSTTTNSATGTSITSTASNNNNNNNNNNNRSSNNSSGANEELALGGSSFRDDEVRRALEEEARVLSLYGSSEANRTSSRSSPGQLKSSATRQSDADSGESLKFAVSTAPKTIDDIFGDADSFASSNNNGTGGQRRGKKNGLAGDGGSLFEQSTTGVATNVKQASHQKPDFDSIKTAIQSATTTLEKANAAGTNQSTDARTTKASDDLFSLLDTSAPPTNSGADANEPDLPGAATSVPARANPMSPFATSATFSPFDLPLNGQSSGSNNGNQFNTAPIKPGNPFPEVAQSFTASFEANQAVHGAQLPISSSSVFGKSSSNTSSSQSRPAGANYTSLGGLEGFGDVLQPTFAAGNKGPQSNQAHQGANSSGKAPFASSSGLSSTGLFKGDLDSTLANLAQNLTFEGLSKPKQK